MKEKPRLGYMCGVDFEFELGNASGGNTVYPSVKNLKKHRKCTNEDGIVLVEVRLKRWVKKPKCFKS